MSCKPCDMTLVLGTHIKEGGEKQLYRVSLTLTLRPWQVHTLYHTHTNNNSDDDVVDGEMMVVVMMVMIMINTFFFF